MKLLKIIALLIILIAACDRQMPNATGNYHNVFCLTTQEHRDKIKPFILTNVQKYTITPQEERVFDIYFIKPDIFHRYTTNRLILITTTLSSMDLSGQIVRQMLSREARSDIENRGYGLYIVRDVWAKGQLVGLIVATDPEMLVSALQFQGPKIADAFIQEMNENLHEIVLGSQRRRVELEIEQDIVDEYGFFISVPKGFVWEKGSADEDFLWLRKLKPEQWIFIYREPLDTTIDAEDGFASLDFYHKRDSICREFYEGDVIDSIVAIEYGLMMDSLFGYYVQGLWRNDSSLVGGPFVSYILDDTTNMTRYYLDAAVFMPGRKKEYYLRMTHTMLYTFKRVQD